MKKLINFSNHPFNVWSTSQKSQAIKDYCTVLDLSFPHINPKCGTQELCELKDCYVAKIQNMGMVNDIDIHIMGELRFSFIMVAELQRLKYRCLVSTSNRIITEFGNGAIMKKFEFSKFESYPDIYQLA